jgi:transcriptional regulator with XRE-family HTH domain
MSERRMVFAHGFSEGSAMALHYTIAAEKAPHPAEKAPHPTDKHVGSRVRMARKMMAMSQKQLADALGITYQQLQREEKGLNRIGASRLQQISQVLQVPVASFFEDTPNPSQHESDESALSMAEIDDFVSNSHGLRLMKAFMRIDNVVLRRRIVRLVQKIAGDDGN